MTALYLVLLLIAAACFALDAFTDVRSTRVNLIAAGLLSWVLVAVIQTARIVF